MLATPVNLPERQAAAQRESWELCALDRRRPSLGVLFFESCVKTVGEVSSDMWCDGIARHLRCTIVSSYEVDDVGEQDNTVGLPAFMIRGFCIVKNIGRVESQALAACKRPVLRLE